MPLDKGSGAAAGVIFRDVPPGQARVSSNQAMPVPGLATGGAWKQSPCPPALILSTYITPSDMCPSSFLLARDGVIGAVCFAGAEREAHNGTSMSWVH